MKSHEIRPGLESSQHIGIPGPQHGPCLEKKWARMLVTDDKHPPSFPGFYMFIHIIYIYIILYIYILYYIYIILYIYKQLYGIFDVYELRGIYIYIVYMFNKTTANYILYVCLLDNYYTYFGIVLRCAVEM